MKEENDGRIPYELWALRIAYKAKRRGELYVVHAIRGHETWREMYNSGMNSDEAYAKARSIAFAQYN